MSIPSRWGPLPRHFTLPTSTTGPVFERHWSPVPCQRERLSARSRARRKTSVPSPPPKRRPPPPPEEKKTPRHDLVRFAARVGRHSSSRILLKLAPCHLDWDKHTCPLDGRDAALDGRNIASLVPPWSSILAIARRRSALRAAMIHLSHRSLAFLGAFSIVMSSPRRNQRRDCPHPMLSAAAPLHKRSYLSPGRLTLKLPSGKVCPCSVTTRRAARIRSQSADESTARTFPA